MYEQATLSANKTRLHLHYGPIDLIVKVDAIAEVRSSAFRAATAAFAGLLDTLVSELPVLRSALSPQDDQPLPNVTGPVAIRMLAATAPLRQRRFLTPMAAVAGAVADEIGAAIAAIPESHQIQRWMVNNGGDIALGLAPSGQLTIGVALDERVDQKFEIRESMGIGGVATSGWRGRSFSFGIADAVTVLATSAASADAAATLLANEVDLPGHSQVQRGPANQQEADTDLGERPVTLDVGQLDPAEVDIALSKGLALAELFVDSGSIRGVALQLQGQTRFTGCLATAQHQDETRGGLPHGRGTVIHAS